MIAVFHVPRWEDLVARNMGDEIQIYFTDPQGNLITLEFPSKRVARKWLNEIADEIDVA